MRSPTLTFARFLARIPSFVGNAVSLDDAKDAIRRGLADREESFLRTAAELIYDNPKSPYRPLLESAGCELGDLRDSVRRDGLEPTLRRLRAEGVYVSFEEFKGRAPLLRGGRQVDVRPADFANPRTSAALLSTSGGTTGTAAQAAIDLDHLAADFPIRVAFHAANDILGAPTATWRQLLPSPSGIMTNLADAGVGQTHERWFAPSTPFESPMSRLRYRAAFEAIAAAARLGGVRLPRPEEADYDRADIVARWAAETARRQGRALVKTSVGGAVRVAQAALDHGLDLNGVTFQGGSEPATSAKVRTVARSGARHVSDYWMSEMGHVAVGCARPTSPNDLHLLAHAHAVIQDERRIAGSVTTVGSFLVTSVRPTGPTIALNVEVDDYGQLDSPGCGCLLGELGLVTHLRDIFSFSKLTGAGLTLVGNDLVRVLEDVLPGRFGGTALDYQLWEEEDDQGVTRLTVVVSPRVRLDDPAALIEAMLDALGTSRLQTEVRHVWRRSGMLRVKRAEPVLTRTGKHMPLVSSLGTPGVIPQSGE